MTNTDRASAAHDAIKQYNLSTLIKNQPQASRVPAWNLDAPVRVVVECHGDWGVEMWLDDPISLTP
jgi:hypothetical protein